MLFGFHFLLPTRITIGYKSSKSVDMAQERDRPNAVLPSTDQSAHAMTEPSGQSRITSTVSTTRSIRSEDRESLNKGNESSPSEDGQQVNLAKYGLPEAIKELSQVVPETLDSIIRASVENILSQITAEREVHLRLQEEERWKSEDNGERAKNKVRVVVTGKAVDRVLSKPTTTDGSHSSSEPLDTRLIHTPPPSEGIISLPTTMKPSPVTENETDFALETTSFEPRKNGSHTANTNSSSSNPKKWKLLRELFRRLSETDQYLGLFHHRSTGELHYPDLRSRLQITKQALHLSQETAFVSQHTSCVLSRSIC